MKTDDQARILRELIDRIKAEMLMSIECGDVPEEWDGVELREWLAAKVNYERPTPAQLNGTRKKDFNNERIVRNL